MKTKLILIVMLFVSVMPITLSAATKWEDRDAAGDPIYIADSALENPALKDVLSVPSAVPLGPRDVLQEYEAEMVAVTQKFSATLNVVTESVQRGQLSSAQGQELSAEQYQLAHMQFEVLSAWREMLQQDLARVPAAAVEATPAPAQQHEILMVALPFSSFELNASLVEYLNLTSSQVEAIQQLMARESRNLKPLMAQLRSTREKLLVTDAEHTSEKEIRSLAITQAGLLAKLIVANARMQAKIYKLLSPEQQRRVDELKRSGESPAIANR